MNAVVSLRPGSEYTGAQLALIKRTVAKDTNPDEFDLFISVARMKGLDPFSKQISAIVFNKDKPDKRSMSIITTIDGLRAIAARSGRYRPDEDEPQIEYDPAAKNPRTNPLGIVKAVVKIYIADVVTAGGWRPVSGVAYWDEFAPIKDEWAWDDAANKRKPTGQQTLDGNWPKMGRVMISKCAEAQAIRKAFPEDTSGLYERAEMDRAEAIDLTATEIIGAFETENRLARIGAAGGIMFQLSPASPLESIPLGQIADRVLEAAKDFDLQRLRWFESANTHPLREFWARAQSDALEVKKALEKRRDELVTADAEVRA
jgi:phage recombination protein Bet